MNKLPIVIKRSVHYVGNRIFVVEFGIEQDWITQNTSEEMFAVTFYEQGKGRRATGYQPMTGAGYIKSLRMYLEKVSEYREFERIGEAI